MFLIKCVVALLLLGMLMMGCSSTSGWVPNREIRLTEVHKDGTRIDVTSKETGLQCWWGQPRNILATRNVYGLQETSKIPMTGAVVAGTGVIGGALTGNITGGAVAGTIAGTVIDTLNKPKQTTSTVPIIVFPNEGK